LSYSISLHNGDLVYILNNIEYSLPKKPQTSENLDETKISFSKKNSLIVTHVYGSALNYSKSLNKTCLPR
jgi:hypothetical protein